MFVSQYRAEYNGFELWRIDIASGKRTLLIPIKRDANEPREEWTSVLGAFPSPDGRFLYFARHIGANDFDRLPEWTIVRRELATDKDEVLVSAPRSPAPICCSGLRFALRCRMTASSSSTVHAIAARPACDCSIWLRAKIAGSAFPCNRTNCRRPGGETCCRGKCSAWTIAQ